MKQHATSQRMDYAHHREDTYLYDSYDNSYISLRFRHLVYIHIHVTCSYSYTWGLFWKLWYPKTTGFALNYWYYLILLYKHEQWLWWFVKGFSILAKPPCIYIYTDGFNHWLVDGNKEITQQHDDYLLYLRLISRNHTWIHQFMGCINCLKMVDLWHWVYHISRYWSLLPAGKYVMN